MAGFEELFAGATSYIAGPNNPVAPFISVSSDKQEDQVLLEEYTTLRSSVFAQYLQSVMEDERYYLLQFGDELIPTEWRSRGFRPTLPPTAYNAVEAASNHILTTPDIMVPERPTQQEPLEEQAIAALKASGLLFIWHQIFKQGDPLGHGKKDLIKWGKMVLKKVIDFDALERVSAGRPTFPWKVYQISPTQVFEDPVNPYDPSYVFEAYETTKQQAMLLFPQAPGNWKLKGRMLDKVKVLEYWEKPKGTSKGIRRIWIENERVLSKPNPYYWVCGYDDKGHEQYDGYVPYFICDSAWGDGDVGAAPHERYVGLIRRVHSLLETEARQLTASDAQLRISTFPILNLKGIEEDDEHPIRIGPGAKIHTDETQDITVVPWPQLDPALFNMLTRVHTYINELVQFQTLSGVPQSGVDSATEADQNFRAASAKLAGPISGLKSIITRMNECFLMDIEHIFEKPIALYGAVDGSAGSVILEPAWITGFYENFVELKTSDERALDAANAVRWANLYQTFGLDKRFAMKMAGIPNPQQRIAMRMQEDVLLDPQMHQLRVAQAMQQQGGEFGELLMMNAINQMLSGMPPNSATAPAVSSAEPMMAGVGLANEPAQSGGGGFGANDPNAIITGNMPTPPPIQRNAARAVGFNRAMMMRPDLSYGGGNR